MKLRPKIIRLLALTFTGGLLLPPTVTGQTKESRLTICRVKYSGGGDWYSDPSSLPNLLAFIDKHTEVVISPTEARASLEDEDLFGYPYLYLTGHGNIRLSQKEIIRLRTHLLGGRIPSRGRQLRAGQIIPAGNEQGIPR